MAALSRKSAMVVVEAMGDQHRLGITTFGKAAHVIHPLDRISTVSEKMAALQTLNEAAFDGDRVDLTVGLGSAMASLEAGGAKSAERVIILLAGAPSKPDTAAGIAAFKSELAPSLLGENIRLYVVATENADVSLLQQTANLTGGKLLAAFDVETMTDALDMVVEKLAPPETVVVTKEVPVKIRMAEARPESPDEKLKRNQQQSRYVMLIGIFGGTLLVLLLGILFLQLLAMRRAGIGSRRERKFSGGDKGKSGFAGLRDLGNAVNNTVVDLQEMVEQLNLDLEDFGVEKWRREKLLFRKLGDLAGGIFLILDHLAVRGATEKSEGDWARKLEQLLQDAGIEEMQVSKGDAFDGLYHKHVAAADADLPKGRVVEVKRPGYVLREADTPKEELVLRQAEVVVSLGNKKGAREEA
jgi:hypothetical protein